MIIFLLSVPGMKGFPASGRYIRIFPDIEEEIARFDQLGLCGLKIHPEFQEIYVNDPRMNRIYRAVGGRMPILVHMGNENLDYSALERLPEAMDRMPEQIFIAAHFGGYCRWDEAKNIFSAEKMSTLIPPAVFRKSPAPRAGR